MQTFTHFWWLVCCAPIPETAAEAASRKRRERERMKKQREKQAKKRERDRAREAQRPNLSSRFDPLGCCTEVDIENQSTGQ
ncbi:MAG: hypothetical protein HC767_01780 [Akkermansiaceae bacterium]|nr:hypothetical protein [Akkermansiaceae bacterium]